MASILDLQQFAENKKNIEMEQNPFYQLVKGFGAGVQNRIEEDNAMRRAKLAQEMEFRNQLLEQQRIEQNNQRAVEQLQRTISNINAFQSAGEDKTMPGDVKRVTSGDKRIIDHRKVRLIPKGGMSVKDGKIVTDIGYDIKEESPTEKIQSEIAYDFYKTPDEVVKRAYELGVPARDIESIVATLQVPGVIGGQGNLSEQPTQEVVPPGMRSKGFAPNKLGVMVHQGYEPIPASEKKAEQEMATAASAEQTKAETAKMNAESALNAIKIIRGDMSSFGVMGPVPAIGGTKKYEWAKNIDRIKSMLTLEKLNEMRRASASGNAGLGPLTDRDMQKLESAATDLDRGLSPKAADRALTDIEDIFNRVLQPKSQAQQQKQLPANDPLGLR